MGQERPFFQLGGACEAPGMMPVRVHPKVVEKLDSWLDRFLQPLPILGAWVMAILLLRNLG